MTAPVPVGSSGVVTGTTSVVTPAQIGLAGDDVALRWVFHKGTTTPATPVGWTTLATLATDDGRLSIHWRRIEAANPNQGTVTTTGLTSVSLAGYSYWRGCPTTGDPFVLASDGALFKAVAWASETYGLSYNPPSFQTPGDGGTAIALEAYDNDASSASWQIHGSAATVELGDNMSTTGTDIGGAFAYHAFNSGETVEGFTVAVTEGSAGTASNLAVLIMLKGMTAGETHTTTGSATGIRSTTATTTRVAQPVANATGIRSTTVATTAQHRPAANATGIRSVTRTGASTRTTTANALQSHGPVTVVTTRRTTAANATSLRSTTASVATLRGAPAGGAPTPPVATYDATASGVVTGVNSTTGGSVTPTTGKVVVAVAASTATGAPVDDIALSGWGYTWTKRAQTLYANRRRIWLFEGEGTPTTGGLTLIYTPQSGVNLQELQWLVVPVDDAAEVNFTAGAVAGAHSVGAENFFQVTVGATPGTDDRVLAFGAFEDSVAGVTSEAGFTELADVGSTNVRRMAAMVSTGSSDTTPRFTWTNTNNGAGMVAAVLKAGTTPGGAEPYTIQITLNATSVTQKEDPGEQHFTSGNATGVRSVTAVTAKLATGAADATGIRSTTFAVTAQHRPAADAPATRAITFTSAKLATGAANITATRSATFTTTTVRPLARDATGIRSTTRTGSSTRTTATDATHVHTVTGQTIGAGEQHPTTGTATGVRGVTAVTVKVALSVANAPGFRTVSVTTTAQHRPAADATGIRSVTRTGSSLRTPASALPQAQRSTSAVVSTTRTSSTDLDLTLAATWSVETQRPTSGSATGVRSVEWFLGAGNQHFGDAGFEGTSDLVTDSPATSSLQVVAGATSVIQVVAPAASVVATVPAATAILGVEAGSSATI